MRWIPVTSSSKTIFSPARPLRTFQLATFTRAPKIDPMSRAVSAANAVVGDAQEFRMRGETGGPDTPPAGKSYEASGLPERRIATVRSRQWQAAARLCLRPEGNATNYIPPSDERPFAKQ